MSITLYNSLTRAKEAFTPLDAADVRMYVCGPTVYDRAHIGNARAVVVYDLLFRLLQASYPKVTYARNITDVDDKINKAAKENGEPISVLTQRVTGWFHEDMKALGNLPPTIEPRATAHMQQIIATIESMIANGHAYEADNHVLCDVQSIAADDAYHYGMLSGKKQEELVAGARVEVEHYKRHASDFVLWKPANAGDDASSVFESPWGAGRPGWHIECTAMSCTHLGTAFDIHGGGADLKFPHHENEIAQAKCAHPGSEYARYWVHNGFVTVNGEKMSKSLGNFTTVQDVLQQGYSGQAVRLVLLASHYRKPLDFSDKALDDAAKQLQKWQKKADWAKAEASAVSDAVMAVLQDDMNTPKAIAALHAEKDAGVLAASLAFLGFAQEAQELDSDVDDVAEIEALIEARAAAKVAKDWAKADEMRDQLTAMGITLKDGPDGTSWERS